MNNDIIDISTDFGFGNNISSKYGGGIDLLMNTKQSDNKSRSNNDVLFEDVSNLENELNDLTSEPLNLNFSSNDDFNFNSEQSPSHVRFNDNATLGESTINLDVPHKTWDGYGKFNDIPINPEIHMRSEPKMNTDELLKEKKKYLRKFEALEKKGVTLTKKYDMDSNLSEMKGEYEMIMDDKAKQNSIKFQANMLMTIVNGIEFLNQKFDPFDVNLDGWGEQVQENIEDYDEIFGALHDKWKSKANISPELQLLFQLGGSAVMVHMSNSFFKSSSMPNMDDILRQNPDLMRQFQTAAVNSMNNTNPGFSNYMSGFMENQPTSFGANNNNKPPSPIQTKRNTEGMRDQVRPDISMARGVFADNDDGINIRENTASIESFYEKTPRKEMKGPSDLSYILSSGIKTKKISVNAPSQSQQRQTHQQQQTQSTQQPQQRQQKQQKQTQQTQQPQQTEQFDELDFDDFENNLEENEDYEENEKVPAIKLTSLNTIDHALNDSSRISLDDMRSIEGDFNVPKKSKRRPKSDKNTINLDL